MSTAPSRRRARVLSALAVLASGVVGVSAVPLPAGALGSPDITVSAGGPARVLIGVDATYSFRACNPTLVDGYNLSYRTVLPVGVGFSAATPSPTTVLANQPSAGRTTVIWENTSDLLAGACSPISVSVSSDPDADVSTLPVGSTFAITPEAYVNANAFFIPDFDANGQPIPGPSSYTGSASGAPVATTVAAFTVDKVPGENGEGELTRGVHGADPKLFTLRVTNNARRSTNAFVLVDVLPPSLEFLGCTNYLPDSTTNAPTNPGSAEEHPGSGALAGGVPSPTCITPSTIETLTAPTVLDDGSTAPAGSTRVTWSSVALGAAANLAPGAVTDVTYLAGIPLRANTATWSGATPSTASLQQGRNLDNNGGALTSETGSEQPVTNRFAAAGTYAGPSTSGPNPRPTETTSATVSAEDLLIRKSSTGQVIQGAVTTHTLTVETGEYRDTSALVVTDTLPNGTCPLGNLAAGPAADPTCSPAGASPTIDLGGGPVAAPYASATENADGTWSVVWDQASVPGLAAVAHDKAVVMTVAARVRARYRANGADTTPVLAGDAMTNRVAITGRSSHRAAITSDTTPDLTTVDDESSAQIAGILPSLNKRVSTRSGPLASGQALTAGAVGDLCAAGGITWVEGDPVPTAGFRPGDFACFDLQAQFPSDVDVAGVRIDDLLPTGYAYVAGTARRVSVFDPDTIPGTTVAEDPAVVRFTVGPSGSVANGGERFHWTIAARVGVPDLGVAGDIEANLMKMTLRNTVNEIFQFRDQAAATWTEPQLLLRKGVRSVAGSPSTTTGPNGADVDNVAVEGGDAVTYRVDLENTGNVASAATEVWDVLPSGIDCTMVSGVSNGGSCPVSPGTRVVWPTGSGITVPAGGSVMLTYVVTVPSSVEPGRTLVNTAGVRSYQAATNASDSPMVYVPRSNIDPTTTPNTDPAGDTSSVFTRSPSVAKAQQSLLSEPGNGANGSLGTGNEAATVGEIIRYSVTASIPEGTTTYGGVLSDPLPAGLAYAGNAGVASAVPALAASVLSTPSVGSAGTVTITLPTPYANAAGSGDDTVTVTFDARVLDVPGNTRGTGLSNGASFAWSTQGGAPFSPVASNSVTATVVEPNTTVIKSDDTVGHTAAPDQTVTYTVAVGNPAGPGSVSRAHDLAVVDTVPAGLTPVNAGVPVANNGTVNPDGGIWDAGARTITWTTATTPAKLSAIDPGGLIALTYAARVDNPAVSGRALTNSVAVSSTSMPASPAGERTYSTSTNDTINVPAPTLTKTATPDDGTIGTPVAYSLVATLAAGTLLYDATVLDTLPDGMVFDAYGSVANESGPPGCPAAGTVSPIGSPSTNVDGTTSLGWWFGDVTLPIGGDCAYRIDYTAHVGATRAGGGAVASPDALTNRVLVAWNPTDVLGAGTPGSVPAAGSFGVNTPEVTRTVDVHEPNVTIDKDVSEAGCDQTTGNSPDADDCATTSGSSYLYAVTVTNTGDWPAYDLTVTDLPGGYLTNVAVTSAAGVTLDDGWTVGDPDLSWTIAGPIAAGGSVTIVYSADLVASSSLPDGAAVTNTADVPTYFGESSANRASDPGNFRTYGNDPSGPGGDVTADVVTMTVEAPSVGVTKTAIDDPTDARIDAPFTWEITATNATGAGIDDALDVDVTDVLPAGWSYVNGSARVTSPYATGAAVEPACAPACAVGATLAWPTVVSGALQPLAPGDSIVVRFDAAPTASLRTVGTTGAFDHVNTAGVVARDLTGATGNADGPYAGPDDTASARIRRVDLRVAKTATAGPYYFGSDVDFTVRVTNDGPDAATGVAVDDILPASLAFRSTQSTSQGAYDSGTGRWTVGSLANGATATLVIRARIAALGSITNLAQVASADQWDPDSTPGNAGSAPAEDDTASVQLDTVPTSLGDLVWFDVDGDGVHDPGEPGLGGVTVRLESAGNDGNFGTLDDFWGPDGVASTGDDLTVTSVVTSPTGAYGFANLPVGQFRVLVDSSTLPPGMAQTYDDDATSGGSLDHRSGVITLDGVLPYLGADFGYTGTGSIGDTVWRDDDADGVIDPGEDGIGGVRVVVTWSGVDGVLGNADDVSFETVTASDGTYRIDRLPAGSFAVVVDPTTLSVGLAGAWEPDGVLDGRVDTTLTPGQQRDDADFGYRMVNDLSITKTHTGNFAVGQQGVYTLTVTNEGPAGAPVVTVTDDLPAGLTFVSAAGPGVSCATVAQALTCTASSGLAVGASLSITLTVSVGSAAVPSVVNTARVSSPVFDLKQSNNTASDPTLVPVADLVITKSLVGRLVAGETAQYQLSVRNAGPSIAPAGVIVTDPLPSALQIVSASGKGWACDVSGPVVCRTTSDLAVGSTAVVDLVVDVAVQAYGTVTNRATVSSPLPAAGGLDDPVTQNNSDTVATAVEPNSSLRRPLAFTGSGSGDLLTLAVMAIAGGVWARRRSRRRSRG